ncbi:uncharacterized protein LOC111901352 [Lactuca sativa]|uniref:uncharacterized protein LOC111901352 n=1 Tax=Lactuca sativa TaxID=4236 RepID=UPI000CD99F60|nr:uncharacterized protein LOC111901352 [Lactuca sativa]
MNTGQNSKFGFRFTLNTSGEYTVKVMRKLLESKLIPYNRKSTWWSKITLLKVRCFIWKAVLGRIPVAENLAIRGINTPCSLCPMCIKMTESVDHLIITCEHSRSVQLWIFKWCGISDKLFLNIRELIDFAVSCGNCAKKKEILIMVFYCTVWNVWLSRNEKIFKRISVNTIRIANNIISLSYIWCKHRGGASCGNWAEWNVSPFTHLLS